MFIGRYGILAVVIAQVIGALVMAVVRYIIVNRYMSYKLNLAKMLLATAFFVGVSLLCQKVTVTLACVLLAVAMAIAVVLNLSMFASLFKRNGSN